MTAQDDTKAADTKDTAAEPVRARSKADRAREAEIYPARAAEALLEDFDEQLAEENVERLERKKPAGEQYFVYCEGCGKPAIFLTHYPHDFRVGMDDWFAKYKPRGIPYYIRELKCQNCQRVVPLTADEDRGPGNFTVEETTMRLIVSFEGRERRRVAARRELDEIEMLKGVPTLTVTPGKRVAEKAKAE